jgi:hypothetical protein
MKYSGFQFGICHERTSGYWAIAIAIQNSIKLKYFRGKSKLSFVTATRVVILSFENITVPMEAVIADCTRLLYLIEKFVSEFRLNFPILVLESTSLYPGSD